MSYPLVDFQNDINNIQGIEDSVHNAIYEETITNLFNEAVLKENTDAPDYNTLLNYTDDYIEPQIDALNAKINYNNDVIADIQANGGAEGSSIEGFLAENILYQREIDYLMQLKDVDIPRYKLILYDQIPPVFTGSTLVDPSYYNTIGVVLPLADTLAKLQQLITDLRTCIALKRGPYLFELNTISNNAIVQPFLTNIRKLLTLMYMIKNGIVDQTVTSATPPENYALDVPPLPTSTNRVIVNGIITTIITSNGALRKFYTDSSKIHVIGKATDDWPLVPFPNLDGTTSKVKSYTYLYDDAGLLRFIRNTDYSTTNPNYYGTRNPNTTLYPWKFRILEYLYMIGHFYSITGYVYQTDINKLNPLINTVINTLIANMKAKRLP